MAEYLLPKARCVETGETVKTQDLTNNRFTIGQRAQAQEVADQLAVKMQQRTRVTWQGFVQQYTPSRFNRS